MEASEILERLDRIADGIEKLGENPVIEMETAPPVCPNCERMNPIVRTEESGGVGLMAEFVIRFRCEHCTTIFYALPIQYQSTTSMTEITQMVETRKEVGGFSDGNNGKQ